MRRVVFSRTVKFAVAFGALSVLIISVIVLGYHRNKKKTCETNAKVNKQLQSQSSFVSKTDYSTTDSSKMNSSVSVTDSSKTDSEHVQPNYKNVAFLFTSSSKIGEVDMSVIDLGGSNDNKEQAYMGLLLSFDPFDAKAYDVLKQNRGVPVSNFSKLDFSGSDDNEMISRVGRSLFEGNHSKVKSFMNDLKKKVDELGSQKQDGCSKALVLGHLKQSIFMVKYYRAVGRKNTMTVCSKYQIDKIDERLSDSEFGSFRAEDFLNLIVNTLIQSG